jgi:uncharacterized membrane protein
MLLIIYFQEGFKMSEDRTSLGLTENFEAMLCYVLGWVTGLVFFLLEKENKFVRFHAMQSLITFLGLMIIGTVLAVIPVIGWIVGILLAPVSVILWIVLMIKAYKGEKFMVPVAGEMAEKQAG